MSSEAHGRDATSPDHSVVHPQTRVLERLAAPGLQRWQPQLPRSLRSDRAGSLGRGRWDSPAPPPHDFPAGSVLVNCELVRELKPVRRRVRLGLGRGCRAVLARADFEDSNADRSRMPSHAASSGNTERAAPRPNCTIATGSSRHSTPLYATRTLVLLAPALLVFRSLPPGFVGS